MEKRTGAYAPARIAVEQEMRRSACAQTVVQVLLGYDVAGLGTLGPLLDVVGDGLPLSEGLETRTLNRAEMNEHVRAAVSLGDESKALGFVEPLYST